MALEEPQAGERSQMKDPRRCQEQASRLYLCPNSSLDKHMIARQKISTTNVNKSKVKFVILLASFLSILVYNLLYVSAIRHKDIINHNSDNTTTPEDKAIINETRNIWANSRQQDKDTLDKDSDSSVDILETLTESPIQKASDDEQQNDDGSQRLSEVNEDKKDLRPTDINSKLNSNSNSTSQTTHMNLLASLDDNAGEDTDDSADVNSAANQPVQRLQDKQTTQRRAARKAKLQAHAPEDGMNGYRRSSRIIESGETPGTTDGDSNLLIPPSSSTATVVTSSEPPQSPWESLAESPLGAEAQDENQAMNNQQLGSDVQFVDTTMAASPMTSSLNTRNDRLDVTLEKRRKAANYMNSQTAAQIPAPEPYGSNGVDKLDQAIDSLINENPQLSHLTESQLRLLAELATNKRSLEEHLTSLKRGKEAAKRPNTFYISDATSYANTRRHPSTSLVTDPPVKVGSSLAPYAVAPVEGRPNQASKLAASSKLNLQQNSYPTLMNSDFLVPEFDTTRDGQIFSQQSMNQSMRILAPSIGSKSLPIYDGETHSQIEDSFYGSAPRIHDDSKYDENGIFETVPNMITLTKNGENHFSTRQVQPRKLSKMTNGDTSNKLRSAASRQHTLVASTPPDAQSPVLFVANNKPSGIVQSNQMIHLPITATNSLPNDQYTIVPVNVISPQNQANSRQVFGYLKAVPSKIINRQGPIKAPNARPFAVRLPTDGSSQTGPSLGAILNPNYLNRQQQQQFRQMYLSNTRPILSGLQHRVGSSQSTPIGVSENEDSASFGSMQSASSSSSATSDPMWPDSRQQNDDEYQQAPQTIQITAVPNGLAPLNGMNLAGVGGWNGGWNGALNGGWNGRQVLLVNRQPQVAGEWRQWLLPVAMVLAMPLILGALFVPVLLKSVMFLIQILQMLGLLMPPAQLAGHFVSSAHNVSAGR